MDSLGFSVKSNFCWEATFEMRVFFSGFCCDQFPTGILPFFFWEFTDFPAGKVTTLVL